MQLSFKEQLKSPIFWILLISSMSITYFLKIGFNSWIPKINMNFQTSFYLLLDIIAGVILMLYLIGNKLMLKIQLKIGVFRFLLLFVLSFPILVSFYIILGKLFNKNISNYPEFFGSLSLIAFIIAMANVFIRKRKKQ